MTDSAQDRHDKSFAERVCDCSDCDAHYIADAIEQMEHVFLGEVEAEDVWCPDHVEQAQAEIREAVE